MAIDHVPVFVVDDAGFVADPARIAIFEEPGIGKHDRVGLIGAEGLNDLLKVVDVALLSGAVEPELDQVAIA